MRVARTAVLATVSLAACNRGAVVSRTPPGYAADASPRPTPVPPPRWSPGERRALATALAGIFTSDLATEDTGIAVVAADGSMLFGRRFDASFVPASTLKIVVAATALDALGPSHRFTTRFLAPTLPDAAGSLPGLWLVGGGDPMLRADDLDRGVGVLARTGVRRIDAPLTIDASLFAGPEQNPRWDPDDLEYDYAAGTSAIAVDDGVVEFDVTPQAPGTAAIVETVPENASLDFSGTILSRAAGDPSDVSIEREPSRDGVVHDAYSLGGGIAAGETQKFYKPVVGIASYVGGIVESMLAKRGVGIVPGATIGTAPLGGVTLWAHPSPPLRLIIRDMLVNSNNHTAETLLRDLGASVRAPGTDAAGIRFEHRELARLGVPTRGLRAYDGSGLSPSDRIAPITLATLLAAQVRGPNADAFVRALPRVGLEGTVKHHDLHEALGRTRAKSGHIGGVNGLAGIVQTRRHGRVAFAFIVNAPDPNEATIIGEEDRALDTLATM